MLTNTPKPQRKATNLYLDQQLIAGDARGHAADTGRGQPAGRRAAPSRVRDRGTAHADGAAADEHGAGPRVEEARRQHCPASRRDRRGGRFSSARFLKRADAPPTRRSSALPASFSRRAVAGTRRA